METVIGWVVSIVLAVVGGAYGVLAARAKASGDKDVARGPDWDAFTNQQRQEIRDLKADMKEAKAEVSGLKAEVRNMETRLDKIERKYRASLAFIRHLLGLHPEHRTSLPAELEADL